MTHTFRLVAALPNHYASILALNEQAVPHVNSIGITQLSDLANQSFYFKVALLENQVVGFLLCLSTSANYDSLNYQWFSQRYTEFIYVDRIVVSPDHAGLGIGKQLYENLQADAVHHAPIIACEVNLQPANPDSLAFHQKQGFCEVGQQETEGGQKVVCLMTKSIGTW
ncbi:MAG: GNAT family N-acetyltransferase [Pseudomonadota bacterium]